MRTHQVVAPSATEMAEDKSKAASPLVRAYARRAGDREPLHLRLRLAILEMLSEGVWSAGDKLPAERDLANDVGLSLGTVQKTLAALATDGVFVRRHGHGTFVAGDAAQSRQLIHFRFVGDDGHSIAPVYAEAIERKIVKTRGVWSQFLAESQSTILITRRINVADEFDCISDYYIDSERFMPVMKIPFEQLHRTTIRHLIARDFNAPALSISQSIVAGAFPQRIKHLLRGTELGMTLTVRSCTHNDAPISFQQIFIPANARPLCMPNPRLK
jgi:GntR family transcriptional regulator